MSYNYVENYENYESYAYDGDYDRKNSKIDEDYYLNKSKSDYPSKNSIKEPQEYFEKYSEEASKDGTLILQHVINDKVKVVVNEKKKSLKDMFG